MAKRLVKCPRCSGAGRLDCGHGNRSCRELNCIGYRKCRYCDGAGEFSDRRKVTDVEIALRVIVGQENPNRWGYDCASIALNDEWRRRARRALGGDAALAAAGEGDEPALHEDCVSIAVHNAVMDRLQADFYKLKAEIARLKRQAEPLTDEECEIALAESLTPFAGPKSVKVLDRAITAVKRRRV